MTLLAEKKPISKRFNFRLRRLFVVSLLVCVALAAVRRQLEIDRNERTAVHVIEGLGGWVNYRLRYRLTEPHPESTVDRQLLGDRTVVVVSLRGDRVDDRVFAALQHLPKPSAPLLGSNSSHRRRATADWSPKNTYAACRSPTLASQTKVRLHYRSLKT